MITCILTCEGCGARQPFFLEEEIVAQFQNGKTLPKHCRMCRATTDWAFAALDRRTGQDRRLNSDRRGGDA